MPNLVYKKT